MYMKLMKPTIYGNIVGNILGNYWGYFVVKWWEYNGHIRENGCIYIDIHIMMGYIDACIT